MRERGRVLEHYRQSPDGLMRFPLPPDTFPRVRLSTEDTHALTSLAQVVVEDARKQRHELYEMQKGVMNKRHWKKLHQRNDVAVYMQTRNAVVIGASAGLRLSTLPALRVVGTIQGQLEDLLYGISNNSLESMRIKSSYVQDGLVDFAVLASLAKPSHEDPFHSLQLKWTVKGRQVLSRPFVRFRDVVFLESLGTMTTSAGDRIGYFLRHSVQVDGLRELTHLGIVRSQISLCSIYRQRDADTVDVFTTSFVDPMGKINPEYAAKVAAVSFCSIARLTHCAQMKKLMWLLKTSSTLPALYEDKAMECAVCHKSRNPLSSHRRKRTCRVCLSTVCSSCRNTKSLSFISVKTGLVVQRDIIFCKVCLEAAAQTSAEAIMAYESMSEDYLLDTSDSTDAEETSYPSMVSDGGLLSVTDEFDRLSMASTSTTSSFRTETPSATHYYFSRKNTTPSWML